MEIETRKSIYDSLKKYNPCCKDSDFVELTEWTNEEGWDVIINSGNEFKFISLHRDELEAINYLKQCLEYENSSIK